MDLPASTFGPAATVLASIFSGFSKEDVHSIHSALLCGPNGSGKTVLSRKLVESSSISLRWCDSRWSCGPATIDFLDSIELLKREAAARGLCVIVFDNLDLLFPADDSHIDASALLALCSLVEHPPPHTFILGITVSSSTLHPVWTCRFCW